MIQKQLFSFKNALEGVRWIIKTQRNFRIHIFLSLLALLGGFILKISNEEFLLVIVMIFIGLAIESFNTAIEEAIDAIHKDYSEEIKVAKDVSAAAMLIFSIGAIFIACLIFVPRILSFLQF